MSDDKLTFFGHIAELRKRLLFIIIGFVIGATVSYLCIDSIVALLKRPAGDLTFVYLSPPELFLAFIKISLIVGLIITSPNTIYQVWMFISPALTKREKRSIALALVFGIFFFVIGVVFAYVIILPITLKFFLGITAPGIEPFFSFGDYIGFISNLLIAFGAVFELPMVILVLSTLGVVKAKTLKKIRKFAIIIILVVAAIITPPDVVSQIILAVPMLLLFELGIFVASFIEKRKAKAEELEKTNEESAYRQEENDA